MRCEQILSFLTIIILILSGISVFVHSAGGEEIEIEQDEKQEEKVEEVSNEDKSCEESESIERKDEEDCEDDEERIKNADDTQNLEERQNFDLEIKTENEEKTDLEDDSSKTKSSEINKESDDNTSIDNDTLRGSDDNDHELILGEYDIVFEENMTALTANTTFSIYRIEIEEEDDIYTADEIRDADNTDELIEIIETEITDVFNETIDDAFPEAQKDFGEPDSKNHSEGDSGPIEINTYADIYLVKGSLGFDEDNEELNMSDVIKGTMKMGANISKEANLTVEPGHNSTYRFEVPYPQCMEADDTWGVWSGENHTYDNDKKRVTTWIFNNSEGDKEVVLERELRMTHQDPVDIDSEYINATGLFDMKSFEHVSITNTLNVSSVNITDYEEPMLPDNVEDLHIVTSDGLRLFIDNNLTDLQEIKEESLDEAITDLTKSIGNIFGEEPKMESEWDLSTVTGYDIEKMDTDPPLRSYINATEPVGFTNEKLDLPQEASINEVINETLKIDAMLVDESEFNITEGIFYTLNILSPRKVEFVDSELVRDDRYLYQKEIDNRDGDNRTTQLTLEMVWTGEVRTYKEEDIDANMLMDMKNFDEIPINISQEIRSVDLDRYGDDFEIPDNIEDLDFVDGNFIRMSVRNDLVELSTIREETIEPIKDDISTGLEDLFGDEVEMRFQWESLHWLDWSHSEWKEKSPSLEAFKGEFRNKSDEPAAFNASVLDLPEGSDVEEMVISVLELNATIRKDFTIETPSYVDTIVNLRAPEDVKFEGGEKENGRWSRTYNLEGDEEKATTVWKYDGDIREVTEEDISIEGNFDLRNLEKIKLNLNTSISSIDIEKYDDFTIPDTVEDLDYVDAKFIRTAVENGLVEWRNITDEMNSSVEEIENKIPDFLGDVAFEYHDPEKDTGPIIRKYRVEDFQPTFTVDEEEIDIDNELTESLMNSGAVIDFEIPSMEEDYDDYSILLKVHTPGFMDLHNSNGEMSNENGHYEIDLKEGFEGELHSAKEEVPDEQSINIDINIDLESVSIRTDILNMDYTADANTAVDAKIEIAVVEAPEDIRNSLPEEITLEYATADLIRQAEKRDMFDKQQVLNMATDGEDIKDFEGINQTLRDALGNEDIDASTRYQEGTWEPTEEEVDARSIVLLIDSDFQLPLKESADVNAFDIYSINMGEFEIPNIEGIDTNFKIIFPSGIRAAVEETDNVNIGETSDSRSYIEVNIAGDSDDQVTINPDIIITSGILFSGDVYLHGIPLIVLMIIIISLIILGIAMKVVPYKDMIRKKLIREGMEDAMMEENNPDMWLEYIPPKKVEKYDINQDTLVELELEEELQEMRKEAGEEETTSPPPEYAEEEWVEKTDESSETIEEGEEKVQEESELEEETLEEKDEETSQEEPKRDEGSTERIEESVKRDEEEGEVEDEDLTG